MSRSVQSPDPIEASARALQAAYRSRQLSPVEVVEALLCRIDRLDARLHSYVTVTAELALTQARQAEAEFARGEYRGPMHGIPWGAKDLCRTRGIPTTGGSPVLTEPSPAEDATVVARLHAAGAILIGKLRMTEGAYSGHHPALPTPLNPWQAEHWTGVSSSGSGVALAAGLCHTAIGTDTGGSIRFPSGANGVTGLKPTWGRVSRHGVLPLADSLDHVGPMARSAADVAALFAVIAGSDPLDPTTLDEPVSGALGKWLSDRTNGTNGTNGTRGTNATPESDPADGVHGLRIGIDRDYLHDGTSAATSKVLDEALQTLVALGAILVDVRVPPQTLEIAAMWPEACGVEAALAHQRSFPSRRAEYGPVLTELLDQGRAVSGLRLAQIQQTRLQYSGALRRLLGQVDLLLAPVHPFGNPRLADLAAIRAQPGGANRLRRFTAPYDLSGSPTLTLPAGQDAQGLPIGLQFIGRHLDEALLLRAGEAFQAVTDWHQRRPPL